MIVKLISSLCTRYFRRSAAAATNSVRLSPLFSFLKYFPVNIPDTLFRSPFLMDFQRSDTAKATFGEIGEESLSSLGLAGEEPPYVAMIS